MNFLGIVPACADYTRPSVELQQIFLVLKKVSEFFVGNFTVGKNLLLKKHDAIFKKKDMQLNVLLASALTAPKVKSQDSIIEQAELREVNVAVFKAHWGV